ncbi:Isoleucine tRNA synthetase [Spraguea lophii 42_110]|uniref:Probable isoleucine--tRNA ligase, cytoplasmic n=1 Tax=Spraguea lophii (strain 42_110) TaxID=1358809 RepID=S7W922_SPRLO|nr:Isoleucine tRNA synthetase [Spraguea lophii 42_110]
MNDKEFNFINAEEEIFALWEKNKVFHKSNELSAEKPEYIFYDGPPFATGLPHYGHILSGTIKDTVTRFFYQQGYKVDRRFGWDCHGLPVEYEIDKMLGINSRQDVLEMGIDKYNKECRSIVMRYSEEWEVIVKRLGRWVSFENGYKTMNFEFMESVWYIFKQLFDKDYVYRGFRVMPFSTACSTPLSNFESNQNYKMVKDPSLVVAFALENKFKGKDASLLAWTTTPWTLPSNCGLAVKKENNYALFEKEGKFYIMGENKVTEYFEDAIIIEKFLGEELVGLKYVPLFNYFADDKRFFKILHGDFISDESGTGVVHMAPGFGEDDYDTFVKNGVIQENESVPCPVDDKGLYTKEIKDFEGKYVKNCDKEIIKLLGDKILVKKVEEHKYPFCWRSDTPLLYKLVPTWFVKVKQSVENLLKNNEEIKWIPENVKYKKFHNWLKNARDWSISRNRFWGTPIPLWANKDYSKIVCIGSVKELEEKMVKKEKITDIHREYIDHITIMEDGEELHRIDEVLDCWFESGSMPYAQNHYPFSTDNLKHPADFIGEGVDQTRGWFYTLHVISTLLYNKPAFKNVIVNGIVLAEDGKKMSKRLKNYPDPMVVVNKYGADSLRFYLLSSPVVLAENLKFSENGVKNVFKDLLISWYNSLKFYLECSKNVDSIENDKGTPLDSWILSALNHLTYKISSKVKNYELNILADVLKFIDELSNYYIRMNRKLMKLGRVKVLKEVLMKFSMLMAPFTPFFSEYCYQKLKKDTEDFYSVHFEMYPKVEKIEEHVFDSTKMVIEGIRTFRDMKTITLKTPLKKITIICNDEFKNKINNFIEVIQDECNILKIDFDSEDNYKFLETIKPNFAGINENSSSNDEKKHKIAKIRNIKDFNNISDIFKELEVKENEILLTKELKIPNSKCFDGFSIIFDLEVDDEIKKLKECREVHSFIQKMRKKVGLKPEDNVKVKINDEGLEELLKEKYKETVIIGIGSKIIVEELFKRKGNDIKVTIYE